MYISDKYRRLQVGRLGVTDGQPAEHVAESQGEIVRLRAHQAQPDGRRQARRVVQYAQSTTEFHPRLKRTEYSVAQELGSSFLLCILGETGVTVSMTSSVA